MIPYILKTNKRAVGSEIHITSESHTVGIVGISTVLVNTIKLVEVSRRDSPTSSILIPGYTEVTSSIPGVGQFYVDYINGYITFNSSANGLSVNVTYWGRGSEVDAVDIDEVQEPVGIALDIDGTVTPNSLVFNVLTATNPASISVSNVDNYTGLIVIATSSTILTIPAPTNVASGRFFTILNKETSTKNITVDGNTIVIGFGATFLWSGNAWILISPTASSTGFPVFTSDPSSPFLGQIYFNSTNSQFSGWNGVNWVLLG